VIIRLREVFDRNKGNSSGIGEAESFESVEIQNGLSEDGTG
jgi:hypothetical protein